MNFSILMAFITSIIYFIIKFITEKMIMKEEYNLKKSVSDAL